MQQFLMDLVFDIFYSAQFTNKNHPNTEKGIKKSNSFQSYYISLSRVHVSVTHECVPLTKVCCQTNGLNKALKLSTDVETSAKELPRMIIFFSCKTPRKSFTRLSMPILLVMKWTWFTSKVVSKGLRICLKILPECVIKMGWLFVLGKLWT